MEEGDEVEASSATGFEHLTPRINETAGDVEPDARSGHRIVVDRGALYAVGGYNPDYWERENDEYTCYPLFRELWKFSYASRKWRLLKTCGHFPVELASHAALRHGVNMFMCGGTGVPFGDAASNQVHICNLETCNWHHLDCTGDFPTRVYGHVMFISEGYLYVFGGTTGWEYNSDLHRLNLQLYHWEKLDVAGTPPEGRYRHEVAVYKRKMFLFGGGRAYASYGMEKLAVLDLVEFRWQHFNCHSDPVAGFPEARRCHSCVVLNNYAYICGGYNGQEIFGDLWRFDLDTMQFHLMTAALPSPVYFHSASVTQDGRMLIFGGVTQIEMVRTADVYSIWLQVPSLREKCWSKLTELFRNVDEIPINRLLEMGIPQDLIDCIS